MKALALYCLPLLMVVLAVSIFAAGQRYETGKITKVEKQQASTVNPTTSDAPLKAETSTYKVSIQLGGKTYVCRYKTDVERDLSWAEGKEVQARVSGKVMHVKTVTGKDVRGSILSSSAAQ